jgi:hypothetical protein
MLQLLRPEWPKGILAHLGSQSDTADRAEKMANITVPLSTDDPRNGRSASTSIYAGGLISLLVGWKNGTALMRK